MPGTVALVGGDEFRPGCEEMDRVLLEESSVEPARVLVLPTAAATERPDLAARHGVDYFSGLGAEASALMVLDSGHANDHTLLQPLSDASVIYFTGGSPSHLLSVLRGSLLWSGVQEALARGCALAGSSAGAMVLGSRMRVPGGSWTTGLGLLDDLAVLPHHETADPERVHKELHDCLSTGLRVLGIDVATACVRTQSRWRVTGTGGVTLYRADGWSAYRPGGEVPLP